MNKTFAVIFASGILILAGCGTTRRSAEFRTATGTAGQAQNSPAARTVLKDLAGKWVLRGTIDGTETTHDIDAQWILNYEYLRLHEVSRERDTNGAPSYEAVVLFGWDEKSGEVCCLWLDTTSGGGLSGTGIGRGKPDGDTIPFVFKMAKAVTFHTTFIFDRPAGVWRWNLDGEADGKLQPFARVRLTRQ